MKKIPIQVRLTKETLKSMDKLVKQGKFMNRSDLIRDSLRKADEKKLNTLNEIVSNTAKLTDQEVRLLEMEFEIKKLRTHHWFNFIVIWILFVLSLVLGGMLR